MKALHVMPNLSRTFGGPVASFWGYAAAARSAGIAITVAAPAPDGAEVDVPESLRGDTELLTFSAYGRGAFLASPRLWHWMHANVRRYDVIHVHGLLNPVSSIAAGIAGGRGSRYIIRPFGTLSRYTFSHRRSRLKWLYFGAVDRGHLSDADAIHFTSAGEQHGAEWHGVLNPARCHVIPPPLPIASRSDRPVGSALDNAPTVLLLARLDPVKGIELLLQAWPNVLAAVPGARLTIAGDGDPSYVGTLTELATSLDICASVSMAGFVTGATKAEALASATIFVLPSKHENFGMSVAEAMAAGLPVVVSPQVQLAAFVTQYGLGIVCEREVNTLANALIAALRDRALHDHCRVQGPVAIANAFSTAAIGAQLRAMYDAVLSAPA